MGYKGLEQLRRNAKSGISMAVVLCVSAFFIAFAAAIVYTAGLLTAQSNQRLKEERCYQLAASYAGVLEHNLLQYSSKEDPEAENTFYSFANSFLDNKQYREYSEDNPDVTSYRFVTEDTNMNNPGQTGSLVGDGYGNICITLRKELNADEKDLSGGNLEVQPGTGDYSSTINSLKNTTIRKYILVVDVTAYYEDMSYTYSTEYTREETYQVQFSHDGKIIVWNDTDSSWRVNTTGGEVYKPDASKGQIHYQYQTDQALTSCFKENVYTEGGSSDEAP